MRSKLVVHYVDGRLIRGWSPDLFPNKPTFHVTDWETNESCEVQLADLKGVFYVKTYNGTPERLHRRYDLTRAGVDAIPGERDPPARFVAPEEPDGWEQSENKYAP